MSALNNLIHRLSSLNDEEKEHLLSELRDDVDKVDSRISKLLIERLKLSIAIGTIKKTLGMKTYDAEREYEIDRNINQITENPEIKKSLQRIYERIIDESRAIQRAREK